MILDKSIPTLGATVALALSLASACGQELPIAAAGALPSTPSPGDELIASSPLFENPPLDSLPEVHKPASAESAHAPTTNATVNLLRLMVAKKLLTEEEASGLIQQAQAEAAEARAALEDDLAFHGGPDDVRVTYIPENVKQQMREDIKRDILAQAKEEHWAAVEQSTAEWTKSMRWYGDVRFRFRTDFFPEGNDNTGAFPNFNSINTGAPFDISGTLFSPQYNVDQDRSRFQVRARLGLEVDLMEGWFAGISFGTGESNTPVTQNQGMGLANQGQGGNFSKYAMWVDRAFIRYERGSELGSNVNLYFGRFNNPWFATEMMWDDDLGFDGIAIKARGVVNDYVAVWGTAGAFPIFNTDFNFATNQPAKFRSTDKYLYAAQLGVDIKFDDDIKLKIGGAYYNFEDIEGKLSTPYIPLTPQDAGDTDNTRPSFAQKGNTYRPLRNIIPSVINDFGTKYQYQYFGLASKFADAALTARLDIDSWEPYRLSFIGEYVKNTAWNNDDINAVAVNNRGANPVLGQIGEYEGGDTAWMIKTEFGKPKFEKAGDWAAWIEYRYVESDAMPDAFTDNDFGGGGTNFEGFGLGAHVAVSPKVRLGARWMSTTQIAGPPLKIDIFMVDITAKF